MKITNNQELYAAVRNTCEMLEQKQMNVEAAELKDALRISTLPGEILGEVRLVLEKIKQKGAIAIEILHEINNEINYINSVLK